MFKSSEELKHYVIANYPEVTDHRIDDNYWDLQCTHCKITRGFQVFKRQLSGNKAIVYSGNPINPHVETFNIDFDAPVTYLFRCPVCKAFKQWIVYEIDRPDTSGKKRRHCFRVTSVPSEGLEDIAELPAEPPALRTAYRQAIRAMDANAHLAAAAMFRRAVQIITRDLLGATPGNLANELKHIVGQHYNGATITTNFAKNAYIIKEAGNQGAHPDRDPDLIDFSPQDAQDLQDIFMQLVAELFVIPTATKKAKEDFLARRKISPNAGS